ncbi:LysR family transcriptional regulator [Rhodococcus sp. T2V]|uniref:LysR family transcriptional regulator n=1 Tax=Rhodococcus sp. T2V TaxID=3034164 RepID=UPI0023E0EA32|nr:LysR family transcriptional regulator [Rhodococcus sp. T2V]MDF3311889.1 LysR family transcriptional regulator [Rhodococcus sp. T2V]
MKATLKQVEYFVAVAEDGTMVGASARFHVSQSALSMAISDLEKRLGVQLFHRRQAKGIALTAAGRELLIKARRLLAQGEDFERSARELSGTLSGPMTVGVHPPLTSALLPRVIRGFTELHPEVTLSSLEGSTTELQDALTTGHVELALIIDLGVRSDLVRTKLFTARPRVLLPAHHRLGGQDSVSLAELESEPLVMVDVPPSQQFYQSALGSLGVAPTVRYRTGSVEGARALVGAGLGWSILMQRSAHSLTHEGRHVVSLPIADDIPTVDIALIGVPGVLTARADAFVSFCTELFSPTSSDFEAWTGLPDDEPHPHQSAGSDNRC